MLNTGGQNEAIERNLANKENQKKQLLERIEEEKKKGQTASANSEEVWRSIDQERKSSVLIDLVKRFGIEFERNNSEYCSIKTKMSKGILLFEN